MARNLKLFDQKAPLTENPCDYQIKKGQESLDVERKGQLDCRSLFQDTGSELMPTDLKFYQMFGGEKVRNIISGHIRSRFSFGFVRYPRASPMYLTLSMTWSVCKGTRTCFLYHNGDQLQSFLPLSQVIFEKEEVASMKTFGGPGKDGW